MLEVRGFVVGKGNEREAKVFSGNAQKNELNEHQLCNVNAPS